MSPGTARSRLGPGWRAKGPAAARRPGAPLFVRRLSVTAATVGVMLALMFASPNGTLMQVVPGFMLVLSLYLAPVLWARDPDLFSPVVFSSLMTGLSLATSLTAFFYSGDLSLSLVSDKDPDEQIQLIYRVLLLLGLSQISYLAAYSSRFGASTASWFPKVAGLKWQPRRLVAVSIVGFGIFIVCYWQFQRRLGVSLFDITQLGSGKAVWRNDPTLSWMTRGIQLAFIPLLMLFVEAQRRGSRGRVIVAITTIVMVGLLVTRLGQRVYMFQAGLMSVMIYHYLRRRVRLSMLVVAWFLCILALNVLGEFRDPVREISDRSVMDRMLSPVGSLVQHDTERQRFSAMALIVDSFPERQPFLMGRSWLALLVAPIPQWIWPEKVGFSPWRDTAIVANLTGAPLPSTYPATLYANFSWVGVMLGMALLGIIHHGLYAWLRQHPKDPSVVLLYTLFIPSFGLTPSGVGSFLQYFFPAWLAVRLIGIRIQGRSRGMTQRAGGRPEMRPVGPLRFAQMSGGSR